jgi:hypothetical protein
MGGGHPTPCAILRDAAPTWAIAHDQAPRRDNARANVRDPALSVFSKPGMSLVHPEIDDAKRVDPL